MTSPTIGLNHDGTLIILILFIYGVMIPTKRKSSLNLNMQLPIVKCNDLHMTRDPCT